MRKPVTLLALTAALVFALAAPASAAPAPTAIGTTPVSSFDYSYGGVTIHVPTGCMLTHYIQGDGKRVTSENAGTDCSGVGWWSGGFCNWRIDFIYYDDNDRHYLTNRGPTHHSCDHSTVRYEEKDWNVPKYGQACATFSVSGAERARQCHWITS